MKQFYLEIESKKAAEITYNHKDYSETHSGLFTLNGNNLYPLLNCMDFLIALNRRNKFFVRHLNPSDEEDLIEVDFERVSKEDASNRILHGEIKRVFYLTNGSVLSPVVSVERFVKLVFEEKVFYRQIVNEKRQLI